MNQSQNTKHRSNTYNTHNSQIYQKILEDQHDEPFEQLSPQKEQNVDEESIEMVIEFGGNNSASLMVGPKDDPVALAQRFCFKHNIDPRIISTLAGNIRSLQASSFSQHYRESSYKIERNNQSCFDDKENSNSIANQDRKIDRSSTEKGDSTSKNKASRNRRNKTGQSSFNDSTILSNSRSGVQTGAVSTRYNVFDRLYKDSRKKNIIRGGQTMTETKRQASRMSLNTTNNINRSINESSITSCLHIYEKNTKLKEESKRHNQHLLEMKKQREVQECKFKPDINPLSSMIASKLRELDESSIVNRSVNDRQMTKIKEYLLKRQEEEMKECTFKPKIITKLSGQSQKSNQRFMLLHEDFNMRQAKKRLISQEKNKLIEQEHHPKINKISKIIVNKDFFERLQADNQKRIQKHESKQKIRQERTSIEKRPSTGRPPVNRNLGDKTIGQYLFEKAKASRAISVKQQPKVLTDPRSALIHAQLKKMSFQYLFELLDSDEDGLISSTKINISALQEDVLRLLAPLLSQMEEVEVQLNEEKFIQAFQRLFATFSVRQKNIILKVYKGQGVDSRVSQQPNFQPTLNERSLYIARQLCPQQGDIYYSSQLRLRQRQNKLNRMRADRLLEQYSECTFHPRLFN